MRLVNAGEAQKLTGLTAHQLREWTARRGIISPDAKADGPGSRSKFSWQTVLLLRIACVLKTKFHIELHAHRALFSALSTRLRATSFPALWGSALVIRSVDEFELIRRGEPRSLNGDLIAIDLDSHLEQLAIGLKLDAAPPQLHLFPAVGLR